MTDNSPRKVLITGGTGLIGSRLSEMLIDAGYEVALLSREPAKSSHYIVSAGTPLPAPSTRPPCPTPTTS